MKTPDDWESAIDYLTSGIRKIPTSIHLLYNFAVISEILGRLSVARRFF